jgi:competence protein ComEA
VIVRRIVEGRPYRSVDDLDRVKGIGKKRLEEIRPLVTVE